MNTCAFHDESLFVDRAISLFGINVCQPLSNASCISKEILLVDCIICTEQKEFWMATNWRRAGDHCCRVHLHRGRIDSKNFFLLEFEILPETFTPESALKVHPSKQQYDT